MYWVNWCSWLLISIPASCDTEHVPIICHPWTVDTTQPMHSDDSTWRRSPQTDPSILITSVYCGVFFKDRQYQWDFIHQTMEAHFCSAPWSNKQGFVWLKCLMGHFFSWFQTSNVSNEIFFNFEGTRWRWPCPVLLWLIPGQKWKKKLIFAVLFADKICRL